MQVIKSIKDVKEAVKSLKKQGRTIGFVPTMGYLHEGHLSLVKHSVQENDVTIMSIFVNPTQFGPNEDLDRYPRDLDGDLEKAKAEGVDIVFIPEPEEIYPTNYSTYVEVEGITEVLCGASRPGHFRGVTTVVNKFFNIVTPDRAYFGQKDFQQAMVIKRMVKDLNLDVEIRPCPIIRDEDGLAKSSRNVYLTQEQRKQALSLNQSLKMARSLVEQGEESAEKIRKTVVDIIGSQPLAEIDYIVLVDAENLMPIEKVEGKVLLALAIRFDQTRLIDNVILEG